MWLYLASESSTADESVSTNVKCLPSGGTTLSYLHALLVVKSAAQENSLFGIIMDTSLKAAALYRALVRRRRTFISNPNDQWVPWSMGMESVHVWM